MSLETLSRDDVLALLDWYGAMGVDAAVDEAAHDRFAESRAAEEARQAAREASAAAAAAPQRSAPRLATSRAPGPDSVAPGPVLGTDDAARAARDTAAACTTLEALRAALESFDGCGLKRTASKLVFAEGTPGSKLMLIGEAPGADEDRVGTPFVGRAGALLDRMLAAIGLDRASVYTTYVVPWRPPGNRPPSPAELAVCLPFTLRQIALAAPEVVVCLGGTAAQAILGLRETSSKTRGRWHDFAIETDGRRKPMRGLPTLRPADLLKAPLNKRLVWRDLREVQKALEGWG